MKISCYSLILSLLFFSCNEKLTYKEKIDFVVIRTDEYKYGSYEIKLQDEKSVNDIYYKTKMLKHKTSDQLKPFVNSILIEFAQKNIDKNSSYRYLNKYGVGIVIKENDKYIIRRSDGYYVDDEYVKYIIDLLKKPPKDAEVYR